MGIIKFIAPATYKTLLSTRTELTPVKPSANHLVE